jgi:hypothetical protein
LSWPPAEAEEADASLVITPGEEMVEVLMVQPEEQQPMEDIPV